MALKSSYEFLFFGKDDNSFLENYYYDFFEEAGDKGGQIFVNLEIANNPVDAEEIGDVLFEAMQKVFFENLDKEPYERFELALKSVNSVLSEFREQKVSGYIGNLSVVVAAIVDGTLYLSQTGDSEAYLIRNRYVSVISEGLDDGEEGDGGFSSIASGAIEAGDFVLFASTRLLRYVSKTDLAKAVHKKSVVDTLGEIKDVMSTEVLGRVGLTGMLFAKANKNEVSEIEAQVDTATKGVLESSNGHVSARKETLVGKFFTKIKGYRGRKTEVFDSSVGIFTKIKDFGVKAFSSLFSKEGGKNRILGALVVVIVILLIGIVVANSSRAAKEEIRRLEGVLNNVQQNIAEAQTKGSYDKEGAKGILDKAYLDSMTVLNSGYYREKAKLFLIEIDEVRDGLDNIQRISTPVVLADLSDKRSNVDALGLVSVGDRVFAYEYNALYEVVLDQVQDPLTIDEEEKVIAATGFEDRNSVVFLTKTGKLIEYRDGTMNFMDTDDGSFRKGVAVEDWSNNIYLLDPAGNQIWKYSYKNTRDKFSSASAYLADNEELDLSNALDLAIDASVYLLRATGDFEKYYAGQKAEFYINNAPFSSVNNPKVVYTTDKLDQVYVLDSEESRVLVYNKDPKTGNVTYSTQYLLEGVGELRDMYVDGESRTLYVLSASKIYEVSL